MADVEGVNLKITSDSSQAVREFKKLKEAAEKITNIKMKPILDVTSDWNAQWNFDTSKIKLPQNIGKNLSQQINQQINEVINGLDTVGKKLESTFGSIFKSITAGVKAVSAAVGKVVKDSLAIGGGFEAQMTSVKVISGATGEELEKLTAKAREMGATLPITAAQAAQAMTIMAQRGTSVKDILTSVEEVASLAISQSVDLATASDLLGSTLKNFGLAAEETARVANEFNIASNSSALNISKLVEAMKYVAPSAASVGASLEEALSAMEALADSGLTGEMIGTGLAMVYSKLATNVRVMGVNTKDLDGKMRPLKEIFSELQAKGFGLAQATQAFSIRGSKAALNLAKFSDTLAINEERLKKLGVTQAAVQEKMKSWPNVWNAFQSATEELHIEIFEQIKTQAKDVVSSFADLTRTFSKWIGETKIAEKSLNAFLEGLGLKIPSIDDFRKILDGLNVENFVNRVKEFGASIKNIGESIAGFYNAVKVPLGFLIEHLGTFATISFWGWILGKGLQIPAAILGIADAFVRLRLVLKDLKKLDLLSITTSLTNLFGLFAVGGVALGGYVINDAISRYTNHEKTIAEFKAKLEREVKEINENIKIKIDTEFVTGFEELPISFYKASADTRQEIEKQISELQGSFKTKFAQAYNALNIDLVKTADDVSEELGVTLTEALKGSQNAYESLKPSMRKVIDFLKETGVNAKTSAEDFKLFIASYKNIEQLKTVVNKVNKISVPFFNKEIRSSINDLLKNFPKDIARMKDYIGGQDFEVILNVELSQAKKALETFTKRTSEKYNLPEDIISKGIVNRLKEIAAQGNKTAQSLVNSWKDASSNIDNFLSRVKDAVDYFGASPDTFIPAIQKMVNSIQRIDPLTGKVTEQFKKAHNALKEWANTSFDKLTQRLQKLRNAYEGGFIDKNSLEREIKNVSPQIKAKVVAELEPMKGQFSNNADYFAVVASEYVAKIKDIFGDLGVEMARNEFSGLWSKTGSSIGESIVREIENSIKSFVKVEMPTQQAFNVQNFSQALNPITLKLEQLANTKQNIIDYSSSFSLAINKIEAVRVAIVNLDNSVKSLQMPVYDNSGVISELQNIQGSVDSLKSKNDFDATPIINEVKVVSSNLQTINSVIGNLESIIKSQSNSTMDDSRIISNLQEVRGAVNSAENTLKSLTIGNTYDIDINQQGFMVQQKSDADYLARSTASALRSGIGNGGI